MSIDAVVIILVIVVLFILLVINRLFSRQCMLFKITKNNDNAIVKLVHNSNVQFLREEKEKIKKGKQK